MNKPIRILHVVQRMEAGGTQAFLMNLYRNIDRSKVQFDFLVEYMEKEFYDDEIVKMGGKIYYTNFRKELNVIKFKRTMSNILKNNSEYKIIHIHATAIGKICVDVARKNRIPVIIAHTHNNGAVKDWKYYPKILLRKLYANSGVTDFFACSNEAGIYTFGNKKFTVIHNSIDTKKFLLDNNKREVMRNKLNLNGKFVIGNVGRLHEQKNQIFLIEIFNELLKVKPNAELLIIGNGPLESQLKEKCQELKIDDKIMLLGNRSDVADLYQAMDVFVLPSLFEGLGIVAIEAQAAGLPVVCSTGVAKEAEVTSNIVKIDLNDSKEKWINAIVTAKTNEDEDVYQSIKKAGYDIEENAKMMENFYIDKYNSVVKE